MAVTFASRAVEGRRCVVTPTVDEYHRHCSENATRVCHVYRDTSARLYPTAEGQKLAGFMFQTNERYDRGPQLGGPLTVWHYHVFNRLRCVDGAGGSSGFAKGRACGKGHFGVLIDEFEQRPSAVVFCSTQAPPSRNHLQGPHHRPGLPVDEGSLRHAALPVG